MKRLLTGCALVVFCSGVARGQAPPPNDTCETAISFACNEVIELTIDTTFALNDYELPEDPIVSCTGFNSGGTDIAYEIVLPNGGGVVFDIDTNPPDGSGLDASIYLVTDCSDVVGSCLTGSDNCNAALETETVAYTNNTGAVQTIFLIVDGFLVTEMGGCGADRGTGLLTGTVDCGPVPAQSTSWGGVKGTYDD